MGDRVTVRFTFGGKIKRSEVDDLMKLLREENAYSQETGGKVTLDDLLEGNELYVPEVNYAQTDEIDTFCEMHGIDFDKWHESGGGFHGAAIRMRNSVLSELPAIDGEPMVPLSKVLEVETLVTGMANLVNLAKQWKAGDLAEFEIIEGA